MISYPFKEVTSKRRRGYPSETRVKRGVQIVHGEKQLEEKLGRNDPCPCGSTKSSKTAVSVQAPMTEPYETTTFREKPSYFYREKYYRGRYPLLD